MQYFTNWANVSTVVVICLSFVFHVRMLIHAEKWLNLLAFYHFMMELTSLMNSITVPVYWILLHEDAMANEEFAGYWDRQAHMYFVHIVPGLFFMINWMLGDVVFAASHILIFLPIIFVYVYVNYIETMKRGKALYNFFDWPNDFNGAIRNLLILTAIFTVYFLALAKFTRYVKRPKGVTQKSQHQKKD